MDLDVALGVAAVTQLPKLKLGVVYRTIVSRDESYVMVKEPEKQQFFKLDPWESDLLDLLDGTRGYEELAAAFSRQHPEKTIGVQFVVDYIEMLRGIDLLERS